MPIAEKSNVRFDDIAGLEDAKQEIRLRMILPVLHPAEAKRFGVRQGGGLLLYGPPGTGKTMLAKAVATEVDAVFFSVRPSDIMAASVGQAEANVDRLFRRLRQENRAVLFLDECDALLPRRRETRSSIMPRVVSEALSALDGLTASAAGNVLLVIGATNEPQILDPAVMRYGRFHARVWIGLPDRRARRQILAANLAARPVSSEVDVDLLAAQTKGMSGADVVGFVEAAADRAFLRAVYEGRVDVPIGMSDFIAVKSPDKPSRAACDAGPFAGCAVTR